MTLLRRKVLGYFDTWLSLENKAESRIPDLSAVTTKRYEYPRYNKGKCIKDKDAANDGAIVTDTVICGNLCASDETSDGLHTTSASR